MRYPAVLSDKELRDIFINDFVVTIDSTMKR